MLAKAFIVLSIFLLIFALIFITALAGNPNDDEALLKKENLTVEIHHCDSCGFRSRAFALAEELKKEFDIESKLVEGETGSFNVFINDELIFSKYEEGRFPDSGEIVQKIKEYIGIDVEPCFSELKTFKAYIYSKIVDFSPKYIYVTERGPNKTSLDYFLYKLAIKEGVEFEFSHPLNTENIKSIPSDSIIATGSYSCLLKDLKLRYTPFLHFDSHMKIKNNDNLKANKIP